jgi:hypothetical protein
LQVAAAGAIERAASLAASTVPLIDAAEIAPGNAAHGDVPTMMDLHDARARRIEHLVRFLPATAAERVLLLHLAAVSDDLGEIADLLSAFVDRRGATADLEATERVSDRTIDPLSTTHAAVAGLASSFQRREIEIRNGIGAPLMEDAFLPVVGSYDATTTTPRADRRSGGTAPGPAPRKRPRQARSSRQARLRPLPAKGGSQPAVACARVV